MFRENDIWQKKNELTVLDWGKCQFKICPRENLLSLYLYFFSFRSVAQMKNLRAFRCDHSVNLSRRGIGLLCRKDAASRTTLEVLHIGIYKYSFLNFYIYDKDRGSQWYYFLVQPVTSVFCRSFYPTPPPLIILDNLA